MAKRIENEYRQLDNNTAEITVTRRCGSRHQVLMDWDIFTYLKFNGGLHLYVAPVRHRQNRFYAFATTNGSTRLLHREVMQFELTDDRGEVDHVSPGATLDNRFCNLRPASRKENMNNLLKHQVHN